jgi:hypothetical protein
MSEQPANPNNESNSLEVEFSPESWKTEFHDEITSVRLNGEKIAEIRDLMDEMKSIKEKNDRTIKGLSIAIITLTMIGLCFLGFGLSYLMRFKVDKLDEMISEGVERFDMTNKTFIHTDAIVQLSDTWHPLLWDRQLQGWFVRKPNGAKRNFYDQIILPKKAFLELTQSSLTWKQSKWHAPKDFPSQQTGGN